MRQRHEALCGLVSKALREVDPIGLIAIGAPADEYEPEVATILPRLRSAATAEAVQAIVHEEFVRWFGAEIAGPLDSYEAAGRAVWQVFSELEGRAV